MKKLISSRLSPYLWSLANTGGSQIFGLIGSMIIARVASPEDFGTIMILGTILMVFNLISELGLSTTIVQIKYAHTKIVSTFFWFNLIISVLCACLFYFLIDLLSLYLNNPKLSELGIYLMPVIISNGLVVMHAAMVVRNQLFKTKAVISIISNIIAVLLGITIALILEPIWGLLIILTLNPLILNSWLFFKIPCAIKPYFNYCILYRKLNFSLQIFLANFIDQLCRSTLVFNVSLVYGVQTTGNYSRAESIRNILAYSIDKIVQRVSLSVLSKKQRTSSKDTCTEHILISKTILLILLPLVIFIMLNANEVVALMFGNNWSESVSFLLIIAPTGILIPLTSSNLTLFKSVGMSGYVIFNKLTLLVLFILAFSLNYSDAKNFFIFITLALFACYLLSVFCLGYVDGYKRNQYLLKVGFSVFLVVVSSSAFLLITPTFFKSDLFNLISQILTYIIIHLSVIFSFNLDLIDKLAFRK